MGKAREGELRVVAFGTIALVLIAALVTLAAVAMFSGKLRASTSTTSVMQGSVASPALIERAGPTPR